MAGRVKEWQIGTESHKRVEREECWAGRAGHTWLVRDSLRETDKWTVSQGVLLF